MSDVPTLRLARHREGPLRGRHPWVFSGALTDPDPSLEDGSEVRLVDHEGGFLARGLFNARSQIRVRAYRWEDEPIDEGFLRDRLERAIEARTRFGPWDETSACRLVFSEADGLSGLTVDRYGSYAAVLLTSLALARRAETVLDLLESILAPSGIVMRTEKGVREEEGLELSDGWVRGAAPDAPVPIREGGLEYGVDLRTGQKTGFYLDQRENRARLARLVEGTRVADVCCYGGGFGLAALAAGAQSAVGVDVSKQALRQAADNAQRNGLGDRATFVRADAFRWLQDEAQAGRRYDVVVLDPPRFARTRQGVREALRAYRRLNGAAVRCLAPGGILFTFSCSGRVTEDQFSEVLRDVAARSSRPIRIHGHHGQAADHPVSPNCPETAYLKGRLCTVE